MTDIQLRHTQKVVAEVFAERIGQDDKWGQQNHTPIIYAHILNEEVGEAAKEIVEFTFSIDNPTYERERLEALRTELIQVAAVAVAMVESLDRNELKLPAAKPVCEKQLDIFS